MSIFSSIGKTIVKGLDTLSGVFTNPITAVTQGTKAATAKWAAATPAQNTAKAIATTLVVGGAIIGGSAAVGAGVTATTKKVVSTIIANPIKSAVASVALPVIVSSTKAQQAVENLPSNVVTYGQNIGKAVDNPSISSITKIAKESPVLTGLTVVAGALATGKAISGIANVYSNYSNTNAIQENTNQIQKQLPPVQTQTLEQQPQIIQIQQLPSPIPSPAVVAPPSVEAPAGQIAPKKKKKKAKKKKKKAKKKKKKTRRSRKKTNKKKKKSIKRRKK